MDQLSRVWHRQPWRLRAGVRLGKEEDALSALAVHEARAERTQPWPWTGVRSPAEDSEHQARTLTTPHSRSLIMALLGSSFNVCTRAE